ncbi:hypothetical protein MMC31_000522 [Peltigera leucophlebia]|nr:hypothetical protein [Peltigera leucophlebia]
MQTKALKTEMFTYPPSLLTLFIIWATIYSLADSVDVGDTAIPVMGVWNPSVDDSASRGSSEEGVGLAGFLDSSESEHVSTSPLSSDHEVVADGRNSRCSTPRKMRRDPQSCKLLPAPGDTNTKGSVGNPDNTEGSGENQEPSTDGIFTPLPGEQILPDVLDFDFTNLQGWTICPRARSDNKPLTAVCDSGEPEDIVSVGIGWGLSNVTPCT